MGPTNEKIRGFFVKKRKEKNFFFVRSFNIFDIQYSILTFHNQLKHIIYLIITSLNAKEIIF
jgi:hypothetical protein